MAKKTVTIFPKKTVELFGELEDIAKTLKLGARSDKRFKRAKEVLIERIRNKNSLKVKAFSARFKFQVLHRLFKIIYCEMNAADIQWLSDSGNVFSIMGKLRGLMDTNVFVYLRNLLVYLKFTLKAGRYVPDDKISVDGIISGVEYAGSSSTDELCPDEDV